MAAPVRWKVPYQVTIKATDLASRKAITNAFYVRCDQSSAAPPAYGQPIPGSSDISLALDSFATAYGFIMLMLSDRYQTSEYNIRSIVGKKFANPSTPILSLASTSLKAIITTASPHFLSTGDAIYLYGITTPNSLNGSWVITVESPTSFSLNGAPAFATWSGDGYWQKAAGKQELLFGEQATLVQATAGGKTGDALPLFASASIRRINEGLGRNFRSRLSFSPIPESESVNGGFTPTAKTDWATDLASFYETLLDNGGSDTLSRYMNHIVVSSQVALGTATPFTQSDTWTKRCTNFVLQPNTGSVVRRKPRLTSAIT